MPLLRKQWRDRTDQSWVTVHAAATTLARPCERHAPEGSEAHLSTGLVRQCPRHVANVSGRLTTLVVNGLLEMVLLAAGALLCGRKVQSPVTCGAKAHSAASGDHQHARLRYCAKVKRDAAPAYGKALLGTRSCASAHETLHNACDIISLRVVKHPDSKMVNGCFRADIPRQRCGVRHCTRRCG